LGLNAQSIDVCLLPAVIHVQLRFDSYFINEYDDDDDDDQPRQLNWWMSELYGTYVVYTAPNKQSPRRRMRQQPKRWLLSLF